VRERRFSEGELVWKVILPIGSKDSRFGKWSPNWEGPYRITRVARGNANFYETLEGEEYSRAVNGQYLRSITLASGLIYFSRSSHTDRCFDSQYVEYYL